MTEPRAGFTGKNVDTEKDKLLVRLKEAREYLGISQDKVANYLGVPRSAVSEFESGKRNISATELQKLSRFYQRPVSWFTDNVVLDVPADVEFLARTASDLSDNDRSELQKFAEFLKSKAST
tara:strand:- start:4794 stop:5159 length:366 start_codon:yes stop_codon:yes gene_type:complete